MSDNWYRVVAAGTPITQGDIILGCPVMTWAASELDLGNRDEIDVWKRVAAAVKFDVIVMTQACDLAQSRVENVILCPHTALEDYRIVFEREMHAGGQTPTQKAWRRHCDDIKDGFAWHLAMLNAEAHSELRTSHRVVDFTEVYTVPRSFIESLITHRAKPRLSLLPPYREHLSQAFARFFMRVGLPSCYYRMVKPIPVVLSASGTDPTRILVSSGGRACSSPPTLPMLVVNMLLACNSVP